MTPAEIKTTPEKIEFLEKILAAYPAAANYHDLMILMKEADWRKYRCFRQGDIFGGISLEGNFNIYGNSATGIAQMFWALLKINGEKLPGVIFAPSVLNAEFERHPEIASHVKKFNPFYHLELSCEARSKAFAHENFELIHAVPNPSHKEAIERWYRLYNEERQMKWPAPSDEQLGTSRYYLMRNRQNGKFVAAAANSLINGQRLWIGRMFTFPEFRAQGFGKILMDKLIEVANVEQKTVALHVDSNNQAARNLYDSYGFIPGGENAYFLF